MIMAALLFVGGAQVYGQSFKDLLNKGKDVVGAAVKFTGDNVLMNAA